MSCHQASLLVAQSVMNAFLSMACNHKAVWRKVANILLACLWIHKSIT